MIFSNRILRGLTEEEHGSTRGIELNSGSCALSTIAYDDVAIHVV